MVKLLVPVWRVAIGKGVLHDYLMCRNVIICVKLV